MKDFGLELFFGGKARARFFEEVWPAGYQVIPGQGEGVAALAALPELASASAIVDAHVGDIFAFGPNRLRATISREQAPEFFRAGCTLYAFDAQKGLTGLLPFREMLAEDLGCAPSHISLEVFASRAGARSSLHFDYEHNFHVLVRGKKRWRLARNDEIDRPIRSYVPGSAASAASVNHLHRRAPLREEMGPDCDEYDLNAGDLVYFARGVWHETECLADSIGVNFAVKPPSWADVCLRALREELETDPELRGLVFGIGTEEGPPPAVARALREKIVPRLAAAVAKLDEDRVFWSEGGIYGAQPGLTLDGDELRLGEESLELDEELIPVARALVERRGAVDVHGLAELAGVSRELARRVLDGLTGAGLVWKSEVDR